jgi:hypothetical protein
MAFCDHGTERFCIAPSKGKSLGISGPGDDPTLQASEEYYSMG